MLQYLGTPGEVKNTHAKGEINKTELHIYSDHAN